MLMVGLHSELVFNRTTMKNILQEIPINVLMFELVMWQKRGMSTFAKQCTFV